MGTSVDMGSTRESPAWPTRPAAAANPEAMLLCRWLPQPRPYGAFSGSNDGIHVGTKHGLVNLWSTGGVVHRGQYVGPPRGGLSPSPNPSYSVAMPLGGYLHVDEGVLADWAPTAEHPVILRADGETFAERDYGPTNPYFLADYRRLDHAQSRRAIASARRQRLGAVHPESRPPSNATDPRDEVDQAARAAMALIAEARAPQVCHCSNDTAIPTGALKAATIPSALLQRPAALTIMAGVGSADDAVDVLWRLTGELADPTTAALVGAAEDLAREASGNLAAMPMGPLTEEAVATVAGQALRWHGSAVLEQLPAWTLGWIFIAAPLLEQMRSRIGAALDRTQTEADRCRIERAHHMFRIRTEAKAAYQATSAWAADNVVDLRPKRQWPPFVPSQASSALYERTLGEEPAR